MTVTIILVTLDTDDGWENVNGDADDECYDYGEKDCDRGGDLF